MFWMLLTHPIEFHTLCKSISRSAEALLETTLLTQCMLGFTFICVICLLVLHYVKHSNTRHQVWIDYSIQMHHFIHISSQLTATYDMLIINTTHSHSRMSQLSYFLLSAVSLVHLTVHNHSVGNNFRVVKNPYRASFVCRCVSECVCTHTLHPHSLNVDQDFLGANMHYTKTRGDTSSAAHTLTRNKRGAPSCLLLYFFSSLPDSNEETTCLPSIYRGRKSEKRAGQANSTKQQSSPVFHFTVFWFFGLKQLQLEAG